MVLPNFLVIGAAKAGTTSLHQYLKQHPEIFLPDIKESNFFALEGRELNFKGPALSINKNAITNLRDYSNLFNAVTTEKAIGEVSPFYLYSTEAPHRIKHHIPTVKIIAILRNPVQRAYSSYLHRVRGGYETLTFEEALSREEERIEKNWDFIWHYKSMGFYYDMLKRYYDLFDENQIKVFLYEALRDQPLQLLKDIFKFLQVDEGFQPTNLDDIFGVSGIPQSKFYNKFLHLANKYRDQARKVVPLKIRHKVLFFLEKKTQFKKPPLSADTQKKLMEVYHEDILNLQKLLRRDLSAWIN
jgi:hypothetical protein